MVRVRTQQPGEWSNDWRLLFCLRLRDVSAGWRGVRSRPLLISWHITHNLSLFSSTFEVIVTVFHEDSIRCRIGLVLLRLVYVWTLILLFCYWIIDGLVLIVCASFVILIAPLPSLHVTVGSLKLLSRPGVPWINKKKSSSSYYRTRNGL